MSVLEAVRDYLRAFPGLEGLEIDSLSPGAGAACLRPLAAEPLVKTYLDGSARMRERYVLWLRRGYGGRGGREEDLSRLQDLSAMLEEGTRRGNLPDLGPGKRAWSLRSVETAAPEVLQEDGLLVDQLVLEMVYFVYG